ncbi:hypothetical protein [Streptomyces sp. NPDC002324]
MGHFDSDEDASHDGRRPLTEAEVAWCLTRDGELRGNSGTLQHWVDLAQMVRATGRTRGVWERWCWDNRARVARLYDSNSGHRLSMFERHPWARLICNDLHHRWWVALEGRVEISEPSREPGDAVGRELVMKTDVLWKRREEKYQQAVDLRLRVIRIHVVRLYGAAKPEREWVEYEEPTYW